MAKAKLEEQNKKHVFDKEDCLSGYARVRVKYYPERPLKRGGVKSAHYILRRGDCNEKLVIDCDENSLEINGVGGSLKNWRSILLPLLGINPKEVPAEKEGRAGRILAKLRKKYAHL